MQASVDLDTAIEQVIKDAISATKADMEDVIRNIKIDAFAEGRNSLLASHQD